MKVTIDIPKEFELHFKNDRFKDSLKRIMTDVTDEIESDFSISGKYEIELCEMLIEAFEHSAYDIDIFPRWAIDPDGYYPYCSVCKEAPKSKEMSMYCPHCGQKMINGR